MFSQFPTYKQKTENWNFQNSPFGLRARTKQSYEIKKCVPSLSVDWTKPVAQKNQTADRWIESKLGIVKNHPKIGLVGEKKNVDFNWIYCFNWSVKMHIFAGTWQRIRLTRLYVLFQTESTIFCRHPTER